MDWLVGPRCAPALPQTDGSDAQSDTSSWSRAGSPSTPCPCAVCAATSQLTACFDRDATFTASARPTPVGRARTDVLFRGVALESSGPGRMAARTVTRAQLGPYEPDLVRAKGLGPATDLGTRGGPRNEHVARALALVDPEIHRHTGIDRADLRRNTVGNHEQVDRLIGGIGNAPRTTAATNVKAARRISAVPLRISSITTARAR